MTNVLVGSNTTAMFLTRLLREEQAKGLVNFRASQPMSSLFAAAKTLLAVRNEPVALVLDSDSADEAVAERVRDEANEVIGHYAEAAPFRLLVATPGIESLLFRRPEAIRRAYSRTPPELIELGLISPGTALARMEGAADRYRASFQAIAQLDDADVIVLRDEPIIWDLCRFVVENSESQADVVTSI